MLPLLRNDDVCAATTVAHLSRFCELTDKYGFQVIHAITPRGVCWTSDGWLNRHSNEEIIALGASQHLENNPKLVAFLQSRIDRDIIGIHGLWHTHSPSAEEIGKAYDILADVGLFPSYFIPPFNEGRYKSKTFTISGFEAQNFELSDTIVTPIAQLHSWRYDPLMWRTAYAPRGGWYTWTQLEDRLHAASLC